MVKDSDRLIFAESEADSQMGAGDVRQRGGLPNGPVLSRGGESGSSFYRGASAIKGNDIRNPPQTDVHS